MHRFLTIGTFCYLATPRLGVSVHQRSKRPRYPGSSSPSPLEPSARVELFDSPGIIQLVPGMGNDQLWSPSNQCLGNRSNATMVDDGCAMRQKLLKRYELKMTNRRGQYIWQLISMFGKQNAEGADETASFHGLAI